MPVSWRNADVKQSAPATKRADPFYLSTQWRRLRVLVLKRDRYRCTWCGRDVSGIGQARVDHVIPRRQRPDLALTASNCRVLCVQCDAQSHREKGGLPLGLRTGQRVERITGFNRDGLPLDPNSHWYKR